MFAYVFCWHKSSSKFQVLGCTVLSILSRCTWGAMHAHVPAWALHARLHLCQEPTVLDTVNGHACAG